METPVSVRIAPAFKLLAVDRYFNRRNAHFKKKPGKAGKKIWGKEKVKPVFDKANICRKIG